MVEFIELEDKIDITNKTNKTNKNFCFNTLNSLLLCKSLAREKYRDFVDCENIKKKLDLYCEDKHFYSQSNLIHKN